MADDGPRCELLYPENTRECTREEGALSRGRRYADRNLIYDARVRRGGDGSVGSGRER